MDESKKTFQLMTTTEKDLLRSSVLDIGAGNDPVVSHARIFDQQHGDANLITQYVKEDFDCVYSSHCLEHMHHPSSALKEWWQLVKPNGHLFFIVPDEDLYEQGYFPSRFNGDHKHTFTIAKKQSWSDVSINVLDLVKTLDDAELVSVKLNDIGVDRRLVKHGTYQTNWFFRTLARFIGSLEKRGMRIIPDKLRHMILKNCLVDQTRQQAVAQIEVILRKKSLT